MKTLIECLHAKFFYKFQETEMVNQRVILTLEDDSEIKLDRKKL